MGWLFGTGFEVGHIAMINSNDRSSGSSAVGASYKKNGSYGLYWEIYNNGPARWARWYVSPASNEVYIGFWLNTYDYPTNVSDYEVPFRVEFVLSDGNRIGIRARRETDKLRLLGYVNDTAVATSGYTYAAYTWVHVQLYVKIADSVGRLVSKMDGVTDMDYTGDTKPGTSSTISYFRLYSDINRGNGGVYIDDIAVRDDDWPGEVRFDAALVPNGDDSVTWSRSGGSYNYEAVDEVPYSDGDYVYTDTNGHKDLYTLSDWSGSGKTPVFLMQHVRVKKTVADGSQVKLLAKLDSTEDASSAISISTTADAYHRILTAPPGGGSWDSTKVNALLTGIEAVVP